MLHQKRNSPLTRIFAAGEVMHNFEVSHSGEGGYMCAGLKFNLIRGIFHGECCCCWGAMG
jgi:hypothetical protein